MASFVAIVDPDPERRARYVRRITGKLPPVSGLSTGSCGSGPFHVAWAALPEAPLSAARGEDGCGVLWGETFPRESSERATASSLLEAWRSSPQRELPVLDGFHAAVLFHPGGGLAASADPLGIFPLYYWTGGDVCLVASSPELLRHHPCFPARLSLRGLAGILAINNLLEGRALWEGVRRLGWGRMLRWSPGASVEEIPLLDVPRMGGRWEDDSHALDEHVDRLDRALEQAVRRHAPPDRAYTMLLSGGLDSRMVAGYVARQGSRPAALTLGERGDLDMLCASRLAAALGLEHDSATLDLGTLPGHARLAATWEHLANGLNTAHEWGVGSLRSILSPRVVTGYFGDQIVGALNYHLPMDAQSFDPFFLRGVNRWAVPVQSLRRLLRRETFGDALEEAVEATRSVFEATPGDDFHKAWWFEILHRQRFHVGIAAWHLCFGAWPILPIADSRVLEAAAALPASSLAERRAQNRLVVRVFPELARLPLDRNSHDLRPLESGSLGPLLALACRLRKRRLRKQRRRGVERRYYYRIFDFRNEGWQAVRREAEPGRRLLEDLFDARVLTELLPPPDRPIGDAGDGIIDISGRKLLLGLMLWAQDHL